MIATQAAGDVSVAELVAFARSRRWLGLEILDRVNLASSVPEDSLGSATPSAEVEFAAYYEVAQGSELGLHHERSTFQRVEGRWVYCDVVPTRCVAPASPSTRIALPPAAERNAACPCGRGLKYKRCCGRP